MRLAGNRGSYSFALVNVMTGEPTDHRIDLPSVTTIIKRVLARPQLEAWMYRQTVESVEHLMDFYDGTLPSARQLHALGEHDLSALLAENRLRPADIRDEAGERGNNAHDFLEALALRNVASIGDAGWERICCPGIAGPFDGYCRGVLRWYEDTNPTVLGAEQPVWSMREAYAGTFDLLWQVGDVRSPDRIITDLKTHDPLEPRYPKDPAYVGVAYLGDRIQNDAYWQAYEEMHPTEPISYSLVLVATKDGTYFEDWHRAPKGAWGLIRQLYRVLEGR